MFSRVLEWFYLHCRLGQCSIYSGRQIPGAVHPLSTVITNVSAAFWEICGFSWILFGYYETIVLILDPSALIAQRIIVM